MSQQVSHSGTGSGSDSASSSSYTSQNGITQTETVSKSEIEIASESVAKNKSESVSESESTQSSMMSNQSNQPSQPAESESESESGSNHSLIQYPPDYESMPPEEQQQFNAALARGDVILTNGVASNPVLPIDGELPQRYRVTEQGLMESDGVFSSPSLYRQALLLLDELYPPYNVHPHAAPRLIHLLRSRVVELCSPDLPNTSPVVIGDYDDAVTADEFESRRRFQLRSCLRALQLLERPDPVLHCDLSDRLVKLEVDGNHVSDDVMAASLAKTTIDHSLTPIADLVRPRYDMVEILNGPSTQFEGEYDDENACEECDKIATVNSIRVSFGHPPLEHQYCQLHDPSVVGIDDEGAESDEGDDGDDEGDGDDEDDEVE